MPSFSDYRSVSEEEKEKRDQGSVLRQKPDGHQALPSSRSMREEEENRSSSSSSSATNENLSYVHRSRRRQLLPVEEDAQGKRLGQLVTA